jgi:galactokinase/mevalonate kinase-like predicted kinase
MPKRKLSWKIERKMLHEKLGKSDKIADDMMMAVGVQHANECSKQGGRDD